MGLAMGVSLLTICEMLQYILDKSNETIFANKRKRINDTANVNIK